MTNRLRGIPENAIEAACELRRRQTPAEGILWEFLRGKRLAGLKFRRQHPVGPFIVDFCCPAKRLIIEIDGEIHRFQIAQDKARTEHFENHGYRVIRFTNDDISNRIDYTLKSIITHASK